MASTNEVKILCRHERGNCLIFVDQDINYCNLSIKLHEKCKLTDITSIWYKYPGPDLDALIPIEQEEDVSTMMKVFSHSNMVIELFVSGVQNSSTLVATSEPIVPASEDLNGSNGIDVLPGHFIECNTGNVQNIVNVLEMGHNWKGLPNLANGRESRDSDESRSAKMPFPSCSHFNVGNALREVEAGHLVNSNNGLIGVASEDLNGNKETSIHNTNFDMGDLPHGSYEKECNGMDDLPCDEPSGAVPMDDIDESRNRGSPTDSIFSNVGNDSIVQQCAHFVNVNNRPTGVASEDLNGNKETSIHITNSNMGDVRRVAHGSYEKECNKMDNAVSTPCLKVDRGANDIKEGQEFENQTAFRKALRNHAICSKFEYKLTRSGHGVFRATCFESSCSWSVTACKTPDKNTFKIKSLKENHTCNMSERSRTNRHADEQWIADFVTDRELVHRNPKDIVLAIDQEYGIEVSYHKARRGKRLAEKDAGFEQSTAGCKTLSGKRLAEKGASNELSTTGHAALSGKRLAEKDAGFKQSTARRKTLSGKRLAEKGASNELSTTGHAALSGKRLAEKDAGFEQSTACRKTLSVKRLAEKDASYEQSTTGYAALSGKDAGFEQSIAGIERVLKGIERTNPGSTAKLSCSSVESLRIFVAYKASICGFLRGCRPALILNDLIIEEHEIMWMQAAAVDAKDETFPVASAFVRSKCTEDWKWFCEELARILEGQIPEVIFMSDPKEGILEVVRDVFPDSHHRYLLRPLKWHITQIFGTWTITGLTEEAALALTPKEFDAKMVTLRDKSKEAWDFMKGIEPKHWAMSHYEGNYCLMGNGGFEVWAWKQHLSTEGMHIVPFLRDFHAFTMERFNEKVEKSEIYNPPRVPPLPPRTLPDKNCRCNDQVMGNCPCRQAIEDIWHEGVRDFCQWSTAEKYRQTYREKICPLPDDTISDNFQTYHEKICPLPDDTISDNFQTYHEKICPLPDDTISDNFHMWEGISQVMYKFC